MKPTQIISLLILFKSNNFLLLKTVKHDLIVIPKVKNTLTPMLVIAESPYEDTAKFTLKINCDKKTEKYLNFQNDSKKMCNTENNYTFVNLNNFLKSITVKVSEIPKNEIKLGIDFIILFANKNGKEKMYSHTVYLSIVKTIPIHIINNEFFLKDDKKEKIFYVLEIDLFYFINSKSENFEVKTLKGITPKGISFKVENNKVITFIDKNVIIDKKKDFSIFLNDKKSGLLSREIKLSIKNLDFKYSDDFFPRLIIFLIFFLLTFICFLTIIVFIFKFEVHKNKKKEKNIKIIPSIDNYHKKAVFDSIINWNKTDEEIKSIKTLENKKNINFESDKKTKSTSSKLNFNYTNEKKIEINDSINYEKIDVLKNNNGSSMIEFGDNDNGDDKENTNISLDDKKIN